MTLKAFDLVRSLTPAWCKAMVTRALTSNMIGAAVKKKTWCKCKGSLIFVDHPRISQMEAASIFFGIRERAEIDIINSLLPIDLDSTIVELGSSIGVVSSIIATRQPKRIICIEADPELLELCRLNVTRNASKHTELIFLSKAISYSGNPTALFNSGMTSTSGKLHSSPPCHEETADDHTQISVQSNSLQLVSTSSLSQVLDHHGVCDYILVSDIEGAEADIWFSDPTALSLCKAIVVELEDTTIFTINEQIGQLELLGFLLQYQYGRVYLFTRK